MDQLASAYGFSPIYHGGDEGAGQTVAIYELEPDDPADIATFQACYGTKAPISYVSVDGGAGSGPGSGEAALDIETAVAFAPKARFLVYQGPNSDSSSPGSGPYDTFSAIITQNRARVISASWGQCEPTTGSASASAENTLFQEAAAQGQTVISAAGDEGSEDCNDENNLPDPELAVDDPAAQPYVTGVGGTFLSSLGPRPRERVWNNAGNIVGLLGLQPGAGGGGISRFWAMPAYQRHAPARLHVIQAASSGTVCGSAGVCRQVPDVSSDADPTSGYLIYWNGSGSATGPSGWQGIGGTSAGAPTWAGLIALANASHRCQGKPIGFANPALYRAAARAYPSAFNDILSGNNDFTGSNHGKFASGTGFDMASGLGTPYAAGLIPALCLSRPSALRVSRASLVGFAARRPKLAFRLTAAKTFGGIRTLTISLDRSVRFSGQKRTVALLGASGRPLGFRQTLGRGALTLTLHHASSVIRVSVGYPALLDSGKRRALTMRLTAVDTHRVTASLQVRLTPQR